MHPFDIAAQTEGETAKTHPLLLLLALGEGRVFLRSLLALLVLLIVNNGDGAFPALGLRALAQLVKPTLRGKKT